MLSIVSSHSLLSFKKTCQIFGMLSYLNYSLTSKVKWLLSSVYVCVCVCVCVWCYECTTVGAQGFLYKCLGVLMRKSHHKQFVNSHLEMMFATIRHSSQAEREVHLPSSLSFSSFFLNLFFPTGLCYRCRFLCCVSSWSCCGETGDYF